MQLRLGLSGGTFAKTALISSSKLLVRTPVLNFKILVAQEKENAWSNSSPRQRSYLNVSTRHFRLVLVLTLVCGIQIKLHQFQKKSTPYEFEYSAQLPLLSSFTSFWSNNRSPKFRPLARLVYSATNLSWGLLALFSSASKNVQILLIQTNYTSCTFCF